MLAAGRAATGMGMRLLHAAPGTATVAMTVTEEMLNGHAITHSGLFSRWPIPPSQWPAMAMDEQR
jgi:hypothetical protein